jgi:hypothetical protein
MVTGSARLGPLQTADPSSRQRRTGSSIWPNVHKVGSTPGQLTSAWPTSGDRSVGIVSSRTKATEISFLWCLLSFATGHTGRTHTHRVLADGHVSPVTSYMPLASARRLRGLLRQSLCLMRTSRKYLVVTNEASVLRATAKQGKTRANVPFVTANQACSNLLEQCV